jgi:hypothetical protein
MMASVATPVARDNMRLIIICFVSFQFRVLFCRPDLL